MKSRKGIYYQITTIAIITASVAMMGMVVGLYFEYLPEGNIIIRYCEIGLFMFCLPFLLREAWLRLNEIKYSLLFLKFILVNISIILVLFLNIAFAEGGIITIEFLAVLFLMISIIVLTSVGADNIKGVINKIYSKKTAAEITVVQSPSLPQTAD